MIHQRTKRYCGVAIGLCAMAVTGGAAHAQQAIWTGGDGDWFQTPSNWAALAGHPIVPPGSSGGPVEAWIGTGHVNLLGALPDGASRLGLERLNVAARFGADTASVISAFGVDAAGVGVGVANGGGVTDGTLLIQSGGLNLNNLQAGWAFSQNNTPGAPPVSGKGLVDVTGDVVVGPHMAVQAIQVGYALSANGRGPVTADGEVVVRNGSLLGRSVITVGFSGNDGTGPITGLGSIEVDGDVGSESLRLGGLTIGRMTGEVAAAGRAEGALEVGGDLWFDNTATVLSVGFLLSDTSTNGGDPAQQTVRGALHVDGTAYVDAEVFYVGSGGGGNADVQGEVEFQNADFFTYGTYVGTTFNSQDASGSYGGSLTIRRGTAALGNIDVAITESADADVSGRLALGADATATRIDLGDGATLEFLLRDDPDDSGVLTVGGISTLNGVLAINVVESLSWAVGDTYKILDTLPGGGGFGDSAFSNVANGDLLTSLDGGYVFSVHYGAGSIYDASDVVVQLVQVVPEPATAVLLGIGGLLVGRRSGRGRRS